jgi:hypothetical protein
MKEHRHQLPFFYLQGCLSEREPLSAPLFGFRPFIQKSAYPHWKNIDPTFNGSLPP